MASCRLNAAAVPTSSAKQCYGCGYLLPSRWFSAGKGPTGLHSRCKACNAHDIQQRGERLQRKREAQEPAAEKKCRACEKTRPASTFTAHSHSTDGLQAWCSSCINSARVASRRSRAARAKEHPFKAPQAKVLVCGHCKEAKPALAFSKDMCATFGRRTNCRECTKKQSQR